VLPTDAIIRPRWCGNQGTLGAAGGRPCHARDRWDASHICAIVGTGTVVLSLEGPVYRT
jgi:hypothetical protein